MEGINSRLDGVQAAILSAKLPYLSAWTEARRAAARRYDTLLAGIGDLKLPVVAESRTHVYHLYVIRTNQRDALRQHLTEAGIATMLNYPKALPFYPAYDYLGHRPGDFPEAFRNQGQILSLPLYPEMSEHAQRRVAHEVHEFFRA
jgi:dTDP-4-amino-4,6-dideoxygalactose transaminase